MRIFLAGATGVIGKRLLPLLLERGHEVAAMTRRAELAGELKAAGAHPIICDVYDSTKLRDSLRRTNPDALINQLTDIPLRINPRRVASDMDTTNRLRTVGTELLVAASNDMGVHRFLSQSVAFAYAPTGGDLAQEHEPLYEAAPRSFAPLVHAVRHCERFTLDAAGGEGIVLRYGYLYGLNTVYAVDGSFAADVRRRRIPLVGAASGVFSFIHVRDAAMATVLALEVGDPGCYNIVDDEPIAMHTWLPEYARGLGAPTPFRVPRMIGRLVGGTFGDYVAVRQRGASNAHAKVRLGWMPKNRSWREGFKTMLEKERGNP